MKSLVLWILRLTLVIAPLYCLYNFFQGEGANYDAAWWKANALFIATTLGTFVMLFIASFSFAVNKKQIVCLAIGTLGLVMFYFSRENYMAIMEMDIFQVNKRAIIFVPYVFVVIVLLFVSVFKTRPKKKEKKVGKYDV